MPRGRPRKTKRNLTDLMKKKNEILMKFLNYCRDYNFVGKEYQSDTQIADKITEKAEEVFNKIKSVA